MSDGKAGRSTSGLWVSPRVGGDAVRGFRGEKQRNATYFYNIALAVVLKTDCKGTRAETGRAATARCMTGAWAGVASVEVVKNDGLREICTTLPRP